jgi:hypothetical protein
VSHGPHKGTHPVATLLCTVLTHPNETQTTLHLTISELSLDKHALWKLRSGSVKEHEGCENRWVEGGG